MELACPSELSTRIVNPRFLTIELYSLEYFSQSFQTGGPETRPY